MWRVWSRHNEWNVYKRNDGDSRLHRQRWPQSGQLHSKLVFFFFVKRVKRFSPKAFDSRNSFPIIQFVLNEKLPNDGRFRNWIWAFFDAHAAVQRRRMGTVWNLWDVSRYAVPSKWIRVHLPFRSMTIFGLMKIEEIVYWMDECDICWK